MNDPNSSLCIYEHTAISSRPTGQFEAAVTRLIDRGRITIAQLADPPPCTTESLVLSSSVFVK